MPPGDPHPAGVRRFKKEGSGETDEEMLLTQLSMYYNEKYYRKITNVKKKKKLVYYENISITLL